jgi:hypothetical protein
MPLQASDQEAGMAFIRRKRTTTGEVYQVVRSYRDGDRVRQQVLCSLARHPTIGAAIAAVDHHIRYFEQHGYPVADVWPLRRQRLQALQRETGLP